MVKIVVAFKAIIDYFLKLHHTFFDWGKIFETNFIMSIALFQVTRPKQKKKNFSTNFVEMETFLAS